ncbi:MAG: carboxypeptidase regulatory-like domain-containing protein [Armatimonadota bacterium]
MRRNLRKSAYRFTLIASMMLILVLCAGVSFAQSSNWGQWHYYVNVDVNTGPYARTATPVEMKINFTNYLPAGKSLDVNSVRVVEFIDQGRTGTPVEVNSQFDQGSGFDAATNATGEVVWILRGTNTDPNATYETPAGATRSYRVYFDSIDFLKDAPDYHTDLVYDGISNTAYPTIENSAYKATIYQSRATIYRFENKLTGGMMWYATKTAPDSGSAPTDNIGMYYATNEYPDGKCFGCVNSGATLGISANKAVRVTYSTYKTFSACAENWVMKFYSGIPYFKNEATMSRPGSDVAWQNLQIYYNDSSAPKRTLCGETTEPNPLNTSYTMPMAEVYDYDAAGVNGGIGHLMGGDTLITSYGLVSGTMYRIDMSALDARGCYWKFMNNPWLPVTLNNALMVHNGTDQASAKAAVDKALADYGSPVKIMIVGSNTNSTGYGSISGKVTDAANSSRIARGAMVRLWVNNTYIGKTYASALGDYTFSNVPAGTATVSAKCDGYDTSVVNAGTITAGTAATKDISLTSIAFATPAKFIKLTAAADGTWKLIKNADCKIINPNPATTTPAEIAAFAGPTVDPSITTYDIAVPANWDSVQGTGVAVYGWYRTIVNVPSDWNSGLGGKNLRLRGFAVDNAAEVYFNGVYSGRTNAFGAVIGHGCPADFRIPASAVKPGQANVLAIKCYDANTNGGGIYWGIPTLEVAPDTAAVTVTVKGPQLDTWNQPAIPIPGATVKFLGVTAGGKDAINGVTDANGNCTFYSVPGELYTVTVSHPDYGTKTLTNVEIPETGSITIPVTYDAFLCTVSGTVTQNNAPLANARVFITNGDNYASALTKADGTYTASGIKSGDCLFSVNALRSMPVTDEPINVKLHQVTKDVDLPCGVTPVYDDFSGAALDMNKWEYFNSAPAAGYETTDSTATLANGILKLEPVPVRGGIISKAAFPKCGTYEVLFPKMYEGVVNASNQCFVIIKDKVSGHKNIVDLQDQQYTAGATQSRIKVFFNAATAWDAGTLGSYPMKYSIVRTGNFYDIYVNGTWKKDLGVLTDIPGDAYVFLNGYEADGAVTPTVAYYDEIRAGASVPVTPTTLAGARTAAGGSMLSVSGAVVTASYDNYFFIENTDRSAGIKVISTAKPAVGKVAFVAGNVVKADNEVAIAEVDDNFTTDSNVTVPPPVAVTGKVAGELDKAGAAAQGMIVKVAGTVTGLHTNTDNKVDGYFLDDGSGIVGDGTHKGIFVEMDPTWGTNSSIVGKFKTIVSPLTVKKLGDTVLPAVKGVLDTTPPTFTAYNDCSWSDGQLNNNITAYGVGTGFGGSTTGFLKDYTTGTSFPVMATFTTSGNVAWSANGGANCVGSSAAGSVFSGKVDFIGYIQCAATGAYVDLTFSGLDPNGKYEFATTANGADNSLGIITRYTISEASSFTNTSANADSIVVSADGAYTEFNTGNNSGDFGIGGCIARWTNIQPSATGTFTVRAEFGEGNNSTYAFAFNAFMLKKL